MILLLFFVSISYARGQWDLSKYNIQAPTTRDLGVYGEIPVSLYSGRADVSIPLYNEDGDNYHIGVNLNYDTSGFLMNTLPGWTGHGWSLNPGGVIIRKLNGNYDEEDLTSYQKTELPSLINYFNNTLTKYLGNYSLNTVSEYQTTSNPIRDFCPDEFVFNFCGMSGSFFLDNEKNWRVRSEQNIRVVFDIDNQSNYILPFVKKFFDTSNDMPKTIKGFTLIDDNGTQYIFGGETNAIEYSIPMTTMGVSHKLAQWHANSWYLTKIIDVHGKTLCTYNYERGKFAVQILNNHIVTATLRKESARDWLGGRYTSNQTVSDNGQPGQLPYDFTLSAPVLLKSIQTCSGTDLEFIISIDANDRLKPTTDFYKYFKEDYERRFPNSSQYIKKGLLMAWAESMRFYTSETSLYFPYIQIAKDEYKNCLAADAKKNYSIENNPLDNIDFYPLKEIIVKREGNVDKRIVLNYAKSPRLHLTDVDVFGVRDKKMKRFQHYQLNYYNYDKLDNNYITQNTDYWGYYNGTNNNYKTNTSLYKMPNLTCGTYGMLKEIVYPTGGKTVLEYEQNTYSSHLIYDRSRLENDGVNVQTGGLRIKKITNWLNNNEISNVRSFSYNIKGSSLSSGQALQKPKTRYMYYLHYRTNNKKGNFAEDIVTVSSENSVVPLTNSDGIHVGYSMVTETRNDGSTQEYYYTNFSDYKDEICVKGDLMQSNGNMEEQWGEVLPYDNFSYTGYARGKVKKNIVYDKNKNIVKQDEFTYGFLNFNNASGSNYYDLYDLLTKDYAYVAACFLKYASGNKFYHLGGLYKLYYKPLVLLHKYSKIKNKDGFYETETVYNYIYSEDPYVQSVNGKEYKGNAVRCVEQQIVCPNDEDNRISSKTVFPVSSDKSTIYNICHFYPALEITTYQKGQLVNKETRKYSSYVYINSTYKDTQYPYLTECAKYNGTKPQEVITFDEYTLDGNLSKFTLNGQKTTLFWDKFGKLCAKYSNGSSKTVNYTPNAVANQVLTVNGSSVYGSGLPIDAYVYKYDKYGQLSSITNSFGLTESYNYDFAGRLTSIKDNSNKTLKTYSYYTLSDQTETDYVETTQQSSSNNNSGSETSTESSSSTTNSLKLVKDDYKGHFVLDYSINSNAYEAHIEFFPFDDERTIYTMPLSKGVYSGRFNFSLDNYSPGSWEIWLCVNGVRVARELVFKNFTY